MKNSNRPRFKEHPIVSGHHVYIRMRYECDVVNDRDDLYNCTLKNAVAKLYFFPFV